MLTADVVRDARPQAKEGGSALVARSRLFFIGHIKHLRREAGGALQRHLHPPSSKCGCSVAVMQKTKILNPEFATQNWAGYDIEAVALGSELCGGVTLLARRNKFARAENEKMQGPMYHCSIKLVLNTRERFFVIGRCHFPPPDKHGNAQRLVEQALRDKPSGSMPLMINGLHPNLESP